LANLPTPKPTAVKNVMTLAQLVQELALMNVKLAANGDI
jgi:hypothetical protein